MRQLKLTPRRRNAPQLRLRKRQRAKRRRRYFDLEDDEETMAIPVFCWLSGLD